MKSIKFFGALASVLMLSSVVAFAQENGNRDENNKIVRGAYETNGFGGNWFVNVGGGINLFVDGGGYKPKVGPAIEVNVGKWMTPSVGARVGYHGLGFSEWAPMSTRLGNVLDETKNMYGRKEGFAYVHGDLLWNISNAFSGYKETRFWNVIPYVHAGLFYGYGAKGVKYSNRELAAGAGLLNNLRVSNRVNITIDVRGIIVNGIVHEAKGGVAGMVSATAGVTVNLGKTNWKRATNVPAGYAPYKTSYVDDLKVKAAKSDDLAKANKALKDENADLAKKNAEANKDNEALKAENEELKKERAELNEENKGVVFFPYGCAWLTQQELSHLNYYVNTVLEKNSNKTFKVTGYIDNMSGERKRNESLTNRRVDYICNLLKEKYNVPTERIILESNFEDFPLLRRSVVVE